MTLGHVRQRDGRWCIVDLVGKHGRVRTIPMPAWVKVAIDAWTAAAGISSGAVFRPVNRGDEAQEPALNEKAPALYGVGGRSRHRTP
jgi:hypothetical protein